MRRNLQLLGAAHLGANGSRRIPHFWSGSLWGIRRIRSKKSSKKITQESKGTLIAQQQFSLRVMFDSATVQVASNSLGRRFSRPLIPIALIVEDHPDFRDLLSLILKRLGYAVFEAEDGQEALQLASSAQPNLIVTDLGLPVMNGLEFVQQLRPVLTNPNESRVIMLTAYDRRDCAEDALKAGCDAILSKPVDLDYFESLVNSLGTHSTTRIH